MSGSLSIALSGSLSNLEQLARELDQHLAGVAATVSKVAAFGSCPECFLVHARALRGLTQGKPRTFPDLLASAEVVEIRRP
jgi:hypothetical protein